MSYWSCSYAELQGPKGKRQKKSKNIYFKHRCLTWKFITKHESTQLIVMCVAQPLLLTGRCLCCPMRVRYPFHFFLYFFSTESPTSLQCKIRKKIIFFTMKLKNSRDAQIFLLLFMLSHWDDFFCSFVWIEIRLDVYNCFISFFFFFYFWKVNFI